MTVTKEKFEAYKKVQKTGITNMCTITRVIEAAELIYNVELTKDDCLEIMANYGKLEEEF